MLIFLRAAAPAAAAAQTVWMSEQIRCGPQARLACCVHKVPDGKKGKMRNTDSVGVSSSEQDPNVSYKEKEL